MDAREGNWYVDGVHDSGSMQHYSTTFSSVFPAGEGSFQRLVDQRTNAGQTTHVLDLFGSGAFLDRPGSAASVTGVRWGAADAGSIRSRDFPNWKVLEGNLYRREAWDQLRESMSERGLPTAFDLIVARPVGGITPADMLGRQATPAEVNAIRALQFRALNQAWSLLSPNGGQMYFQVSHAVATRAMLTQWVEVLQARGLQVQWSYDSVPGSPLAVFRMTRQPTDPAALPAL